MAICKNCGGEVIEYPKGKVFIGFCTICGLWIDPVTLFAAKRYCALILDKMPKSVCDEDLEDQTG